MKKNIIFINLFLVSLLVLFSGTASAAEFSDVPKTHWAYEYINELSDEGVINGVGGGLYQPESPLTRAQFIKLLTCALDSFDESLPPLFPDTPAGSWYAPYVSSGVNCGIIEIEDTFRPDEEMTRGEAAVWMINGLGLVPRSDCGFFDVTDAAQKAAVGEAQAQGLILGYEDGTFRPSGGLTRAEAAALIKRLTDRRESMFRIRPDAANEIILKDSVVTLSGGANKIEAVDSRSHTVTLSSADGAAAELKKGDVIYIPDTEKLPGGLLAKLTKVSTEGGKVVLTCAEPDIEEAIESIDISTVVAARAEDFEGGAVSNAAPTPKGYPAVVEHNSNYSTDSDGAIGLERAGVSYLAYASVKGEDTLHFETDSFAEKKGAYASADFIFHVFVDVIFSGKNFSSDLRFSANAFQFTSLTAGYSTGGKAEARFKLPKCDIPVAGPLKVHLEPELVVTAKGEFNVEANARIFNEFGCYLRDGEFTKTVRNNAGSELTANAEGSIEVGPNVNLTVSLGKCESVGLDGLDFVQAAAYGGVRVTGKTSIEQKLGYTDGEFSYSGQQNTPDENGVIHNCYLCVEGDILGCYDCSIGLSDELNDLLDGILSKELKYESGMKTVTISPWHYSTGPWGSEPEFALEECPHKLVRVSGSVTDKETKKPLSGAGVAVGDNRAVTMEDGGYELFTEPGLALLNVAADGYRPTQIALIVPDDKGVTANAALKSAGLTGHVTDLSSGKPISGALVEAGDVSARTDGDGFYQLSPEDGVSTVTVSAPLYDPSTLSIPEGALTLDLSLNPLSFVGEYETDDYKTSGGVMSRTLTVDSQDGNRISFSFCGVSGGGKRIILIENLTAVLDENGAGGFTWADNSWGASGTGTITVEKDRVTVTMNSDDADKPFYDFFNGTYVYFKANHPWKEAYAHFLRSQGGRFELIYLTDDDVPELVVSTGTFGSAPLDLYTFENGEVKRIDWQGVSSGTRVYGEILYKERSGLFATESTNGGYGDYRIYSYANGVLSVEEVFEYSANLPVYYKRNGAEISSKAFDSEWDSLTSGYKTVGYETGQDITDANIRAVFGE